MAEQRQLARVLAELVARGRFAVRLGLDRVERALTLAGRPERRFAAVHLAGTNGKGSTAAMLAACLTAAGYRTGLFTSPHLQRFSERIVVSGQEIPTTALTGLLEEVLALDPSLTFFEVATVAAFCWFARQQVEIAVVETGLGGRLDATNVLQPQVCTITPIGLDHLQVLGSDLASIAAEKAGIIKPAVPLVCARQVEPALAPLLRRCQVVGAPVRIAGRDFRWSAAPAGRIRFESWRSQLADVCVGLSGRHQRDNAALALATLDALAERGFLTDDASRRAGLARVRWPGRLEWIGRFLLDSAHNLPAVRVLVDSLPPRRDWTLVFGTSRDKQAHAMLALLRPRVSRVVLTTFDSPRAANPESLTPVCHEATIADSVAESLALASETSGPVLLTGSSFLVGEARRILLDEQSDPMALADPAGGSPSVGDQGGV